MKNKILFILYFCMLFSISEISAQSTQNRLVYWIHGLNEDASFWEGMCEELTPDNGICLEYDSDHTGGINGIAADLNAQIPSDRYVILVGHSAGGLVARSIQQLNSKVIGVITVGTPNYGAPIVNSMQTSSYENIVERLADQIENTIMTAYYDLLGVYDDFWFLFNYRDKILELATTIRASGFFVDILETEAMYYLDEWKDGLLNQPMVLDMHPESSYIQSMMADSTNLRSVSSIHGEESEGQLYRLISSAISNSQTGIPNDSLFEEEQNALFELEGLVLWSMNLANRTKNVTKWLRFVYPVPLFIMNSLLNHLSSTLASLASLLRYINVDIHTDWAEEIGAYHFEERTIRIPIYDNGGIHIGGGGIDGPIIDIPGEEVGDFGQIIGYVEEVRTVLVNESHDGLIPSSSALIRTTGSTYHEFTVSGANHLEMKNHAGIKVCIEDEIDRYMSAQTIIGPVFPIL
ncbi:MAG: hypothetical protein IKV28_03075 [Bacteroidales bacterium]|nr:hypothetical protein [Bacteroidales bacterium]